MKKSVAVLFGGTGLTGSCLLDLLIKDSRFDSLIVVSRKSLTIKHKKISNRIIDFSNAKEIEDCIVRDSIVFSCIGTTQSQVKGDKDSGTNSLRNYHNKDGKIVGMQVKVALQGDFEKLLYINIVHRLSLLQ